MNSLVNIELLLNSIIKIETSIDTNNDSNNVSNWYNGDPHTVSSRTRKNVVSRSLKVKRSSKEKMEYQQLINKLRSKEIQPLFFSTSLPGYDNSNLLHMNTLHIVYILKAFLNKKQYCLNVTNFIGNYDDTGRKKYRDRLVGYMKNITKANIEIIYSQQLNCYVIYEKKFKSIRDYK